MRKITFILITLFTTILFASPPDWVDEPNAYEFTATVVGGIILDIDGEQMGNDGDMFAAFDEEGNVRGVGLMLLPPFGPFEGTPVFEVQLRSNNNGEILYFKYYDASTHIIFDISESYIFEINETIGDVSDPETFNIDGFGSIDVLYFSNENIGGFQFTVEGGTIDDATGGVAGEVGFTVSSGNNTVIGFSLSNSIIPAGEGILIVLDLEGSASQPCLKDLVISDDSGNAMDATVVDCTTIGIGPPVQFYYNQSTQQAFYNFNLVLINESEIESIDWVGAFNGEICVGARQWDTSQCGSGICEVPVMGYDGTDYTAGYMANGVIPAFKIFDASENLYYEAIPSEEFEWHPNGLNLAQILQGFGDTIPGCTDEFACNYDPSATEDDGSCLENDCLGECGGSSVEDNCGTCDSDTTNNCEQDCAGEWGGGAEYDECNPPVCSGGTTGLVANVSCKDCAGVPNGENVEDNCGTCDSDTANNCEQDCAGVWGGSAEYDECNPPVCSGGTTGLLANVSCKDCSGVLNGEAFIDGCNDCVGGNTNNEACATDCNDIDGGTAFINACGDCVAANDTSCIQDCAGVWGGSAEDDECIPPVCSSGTTGLIANASCKDCAGMPNGTNVEDNCGMCDSDTTNNCEQDCAGEWGGTAEDDECGFCGGDGPQFICESTCFACNIDDCINLDDDCNSLDISIYLMPDEFGISKIFPNPFNPVTQIQYEITQYGLVTINIFDIQGREVDQLLNSYQNPGHFTLNWNAGDHASGMYFVSMTLQSGITTISRDMKKILYLK